MNVKLFLSVLAVVLLVYFFMMGAWFMDIGHSAQVTGSIVTAGWIIHDPVVTYHIGLDIMIVSFVITVVLALYNIVRRTPS